MSDPAAYETIDQVIDAARLALDPASFTWAAAGAGQGVTLTRNEIALNRLALVPRIGRDVEEVDISSSFVGIDLALPVMLAPVGALDLYDPEGGLAAARAAAQTSTIAISSLLGSSRWNELAATARHRHIFGVYVFGDRDWLAALVADIEQAGFGAVCVTMDTPTIGRRDLSIESGFVWRPPSDVAADLRQRGWDPSFRTRFTWVDLEWLCKRTELPVVVKGVMTSEDAVRSVDCGADGVYVSNHGGRNVDHSASTIEVLEEVVEAVPAGIDVAIDGGFTRGAEVCKALALGARAVAIGRLQCWGLAAGSTTGLASVLQILASEIEVTLANIGCTGASAIERGQVRWSFPAPPTPRPAIS